MNERLAVTRRVMRALRHEQGRAPLTDRDGRGAAQVVICLDSDTVDYAASRVSARGGTATVVVPLGDHLVPLRWTQSNRTEALFPDDGPIHPDSTLGMLVTYMDQCDVPVCRFRISTDEGEIDVTEGTHLTVPA